MEEQFVPFELAVKLKELGFDEVCIMGYNREKKFYLNGWKLDKNVGFKITANTGRYPAPLWQQAFDWCFNQIKNNSNLSNRNYWLLQRNEFFEVVSNLSHSSEESLIHGTKEDCLIKLIKLLCKKN